VTAVRREVQRRGLGRAPLAASAETYLRARGTDLLQVKTLAESGPGAGSVATRAFYTAMGFRALEEIRQIRGEDDRRRIMVETVSPGG
jgi:GNAT superfamily N-acetyltransferase